MKYFSATLFWATYLAVCIGNLSAYETPTPLANVHRIVFLGDSITQGGDYVVDFECYLLAHGIDAEVINLGLASETASDLTEAENAEHKQKHGFRTPVCQRAARSRPWLPRNQTCSLPATA